jgi:hypothetical protein
MQPFQAPNLLAMSAAAQEQSLNAMREQQLMGDEREKNAMRVLFSDPNFNPADPAQARRILEAAPRSGHATYSALLRGYADQRAAEASARAAAASGRQTELTNAEIELKNFDLQRRALAGIAVLPETERPAAWAAWRAQTEARLPRARGNIPREYSDAAYLEMVSTVDQIAARRGAQNAPRPNMSVPPGNTVINDRGEVVFTAPDRAAVRGPVAVSAGQRLVDPATGNVVYEAPERVPVRGPMAVSAGQRVIDPATGNVLYEAPERAPVRAPVSVAAGNRLVDPATGNVIYEAPERAPARGPMAVSAGQRVIDPVTGNVLYEAPDRPRTPVSVAAGNRLVDPATGEVIFTAPDRAPARGPMAVSAGQRVIDPATGNVIYEAPERPQDPARERRIRDIMDTYGVDRRVALGVVDNTIRVATDPVTGQHTLIDTLAGQNRSLAPASTTPAAPLVTGPRANAAPPPAAEPAPAAAPARAAAPAPRQSLYELAQTPFTTGAFPAAAAAGQSVLGQVGANIVDPMFTERRQAFSNAQGDLIRSLSLNPRYPVAEMQRIRQEINVEPGVLTDPQTLLARMRSVDSSLRNRLANEERAAADTSLPAATRRDAATAANDIRNFITTLGVPQDQSSTAAPAAPPPRRNALNRRTQTGAQRLRYNLETGELEPVQ